MRRLPAECRDMTDIRGEIDRVDRALVAMLAERRGYIERAAAIKREVGLPARIDERVGEVLARVEAEAAGQGLDPALASELWSRLIDWSIALEERLLGNGK